MTKLRIIAGADHAGAELKNLVVKKIESLGHEVVDIGVAPGTAKADYPLITQKAVQEILAGRHDYGVLVCGTGIGMSMSANRFKGIRAVTVENEVTARYSRTHNNANVLALGARIIGPELALSIVESFLGAVFEGGRHQDRLDMIDPPEKK
jgi:ribose 5-phosphate isomerase B